MIDEKRLAELIAANPVRELVDAKTGEGNGRYMVFARMHYPSLDKPKAFEEGGRATYSACFIIPPALDITKLVNGAKVAAVAKFGQARAKQLAEKNPETGVSMLRMPFRSQKIKLDAGEEGFGETGYFFNASEGTTWPDGQPKEPPALWSPAMKRYPQDTKDVYAGCYGLVKISFYGYSNKGNNGVSVALGAFQKLADGPRLRTSKADPSDGFAPVAGADDFAAASSSASKPTADAMADW